MDATEDRDTTVTFSPGVIGIEVTNRIAGANGTIWGGGGIFVIIGATAINLGFMPDRGVPEIVAIGPALQAAVNDLLRLARDYRNKKGELSEDDEASIERAERSLALSFPPKIGSIIG